MIEEYRHSERVTGVAEASLNEVALTLRHFERLIGKRNSKQITQNSIDNFIFWEAPYRNNKTERRPLRQLTTIKPPSSAVRYDCLCIFFPTRFHWEFGCFAVVRCSLEKCSNFAWILLEVR